MIKEYRYRVYNKKGKVKFDKVGCSMRELDKLLADFISSHGGAYRCDVEYKWLFAIDFVDEHNHCNVEFYSILEYDKLFLNDYRVPDIDI